MQTKEIKYTITELECWECTSHFKDKCGYPVCMIKGKWDRIHRHVYRKHFGEIAKGLVIRHTCDNPACINPNHLIIGTHQDNMDDRFERKRTTFGTKNSHAKLTEDDVLIIVNSTKNNKELMQEYNVSYATIFNIKNKKSWKYLWNKVD